MDGEPNEIYKFQKTDIAANNNKWYIYKVWGTGNDIYVIGYYGRVGDAGSKKVYGNISRSKLNSLMHEREYIKKYKPIKLYAEASTTSNSIPLADSGTDSRIVEVLEHIFSEAGEYIKTYLASAVDALSPEQIKYGRTLLMKAQSLYQKAGLYLTNGATNMELAEIIEEYYNVIPTQLPRKRIDYLELCKSFVRQFDEQEERLEQLETAVRTLSTTGSSPTQTKLQSLGANMSVVDPKSDKYLKLAEYATSTAVHGYRVNIENIFEIEVPSERAQWESNTRGKDHTEILFHGTAGRNVRHILRTGLICPATYSNGRMFGNGIYFANKSSKATNYCKVSDERKVPQMLLVAEVALGKMYVAPTAYKYVEPPAGYDSVWGKARHTGGSVATWDGKLQYDEFIVYRPNQQTLRYLITFRR